MVTTGVGGEWVKVRDASQLPTMHRAAPKTEDEAPISALLMQRNSGLSLLVVLDANINID